MDAVKRKEVLAELTSQGYSASYLNSWPPKVDLYRHKPGLNDSGVVCFPVGDMVLNQPGHPDHAARKSRLGWLPWPPSKECKCRACRERTDWAEKEGAEVIAAVVEAEKIVAATPKLVPTAETVPSKMPYSRKCELCPFVGESTSTIGAISKLRWHRVREHAKVAVPA